MRPCGKPAQVEGTLFMTIPEIVLGIILLVFCVAIVVVVLLQEGHEKNVGVINGGADTFLSQNSSRSVDAFLARWTKIIAIGFFALVIATNIILYLAK